MESVISDGGRNQNMKKYYKTSYSSADQDTFYTYMLHLLFF